MNQEVNISFSTPKAMMAEKVIGIEKMSQPKEPLFQSWKHAVFNENLNPNIEKNIPL